MNTLMIVLLPSIFNVLIVKYKRKKTLEKMCKNLEEQGYMVDSRLKRNIPYKIVKLNKRRYQDSNYFKDLAIYSWLPVLNWFSIVSNIKYLLGDYTGRNECYAALEDLSMDKSTINFLEVEDLIKVDLEKQEWLADKENAMKELEKLEKKYDDKVETKETIEKYSSDELCDELKRRGLKTVEVTPIEAVDIFLKIEEEGILDKNNSIDEVYEKMRQLQEIIERKKANGEEIKLTLRNQ